MSVSPVQLFHILDASQMPDLQTLHSKADLIKPSRRAGYLSCISVDEAYMSDTQRPEGKDSRASGGSSANDDGRVLPVPHPVLVRRRCGLAPLIIDRPP